MKWRSSVGGIAPVANCWIHPLYFAPITRRLRSAGIDGGVRLAAAPVSCHIPLVWQGPNQTCFLFIKSPALVVAL